jgi:hypothetical protein
LLARHHTNRFYIVTPHSEHEVPVNVPIILFKLFSTNQHENVVPLDDLGRVIRQIISVVLYKINVGDLDTAVAV